MPSPSDLADKMSPRIAAAREYLEAAREQLAPPLESAREQLRETVAPAVADAVTTTLTRAQPARREIRRRGRLVWSALRGEPAQRPGWRLALGCLALGSLVGAAVATLSRRPPAPAYPIERPTAAVPTAMPTEPAQTGSGGAS
jgi:hypothetical protein